MQTNIHDRFNRHILANSSFVTRKIRTEEIVTLQQWTHTVHTHNTHRDTTPSPVSLYSLPHALPCLLSTTKKA